MLPGRRRPVKSGARLNVVIDMQIRELTIELLDTKGTIASSITVEGIPGEVAVAVSFGPGRHAVRLVGNETEKPAMKLLGKLRKVRTRALIAREAESSGGRQAAADATADAAVGASGRRVGHFVARLLAFERVCACRRVSAFNLLRVRWRRRICGTMRT